MLLPSFSRCAVRSIRSRRAGLGSRLFLGSSSSSPESSARAGPARASSSGSVKSNRPGRLGDLGALDPAAAQRLDQPLVEHGAEPAELAIDRLGLLDDPAEDRVLLAVLVEEVAAIDRRRRLELAVDAAVALLEPGRVPGDVVVEEVGAVLLEVQALAGRVGGEQDPDGVVGGVGVERLLDLLAFLERGARRR